MQLPEYGHTTPTTTPHTRDGGHSGGETPGHIPNPEAKPSSADGTAPARVWESRTPPDKHSRQGGPESIGCPLATLSGGCRRRPAEMIRSHGVEEERIDLAEHHLGGPEKYAARDDGSPISSIIALSQIADSRQTRRGLAIGDVHQPGARPRNFRSWPAVTSDVLPG